MDVEKNLFPKSGTKHRIMIVDQETGEVEVDYKDVNGGFFVLNNEDENPIGTRQGIFGSAPAIAISIAKCEAVILQTLKQCPPDLSEIIAKTIALYDAAIEEK